MDTNNRRTRETYLSVKSDDDTNGHVSDFKITLNSSIGRFLTESSSVEVVAATFIHGVYNISSNIDLLYLTDPDSVSHVISPSSGHWNVTDLIAFLNEQFGIIFEGSGGSVTMTLSTNGILEISTELDISINGKLWNRLGFDNVVMTAGDTVDATRIPNLFSPLGSSVKIHEDSGCARHSWGSNLELGPTYLLTEIPISDVKFAQQQAVTFPPGTWRHMFLNVRDLSAASLHFQIKDSQGVQVDRTYFDAICRIELVLKIQSYVN